MAKSARVLGIAASPHDSGNTATLVKEVLRGAQETGYETEFKCLGDLKLNPLAKDKSNKPYGIAAPKDDLDLMRSSLKNADVLVFGTPIYLDHVSDSAKIFLDRSFYYALTSNSDHLRKEARGIVVITYEANRLDVYDSIIRWIGETMQHALGLKVVATLKANNTLKDPVINRKDLLEEAHRTGMNL